MLCCAIAVLIVGAIFWPVRKFMRLFGFKENDWKPDQAVLWRPDLLPEAGQSKSRKNWAMLLVATGFLGVFLLITNNLIGDALSYSSPQVVMSLEELIHTSYCRGGK